MIGPARIIILALAFVGTALPLGGADPPGADGQGRGAQTDLRPRPHHIPDNSVPLAPNIGYVTNITFERDYDLDLGGVRRN
jgi:hypothetical protein